MKFCIVGIAKQISKSHREKSHLGGGINLNPPGHAGFISLHC
jgi:hypothetical protein